MKASDLGIGYPSAVPGDPTTMQTAAASLPMADSLTPAHFWLMMVALVVGLRLVWEFAPASARVGG